jgi:hypothetical protein
MVRKRVATGEPVHRLRTRVANQLTQSPERTPLGALVFSQGLPSVYGRRSALARRGEGGASASDRLFARTLGTTLNGWSISKCARRRNFTTKFTSPRMSAGRGTNWPSSSRSSSAWSAGSTPPPCEGAGERPAHASVARPLDLEVPKGAQAGNEREVAGLNTAGIGIGLQTIVSISG